MMNTTIINRSVLCVYEFWDGWGIPGGGGKHILVYVRTYRLTMCPHMHVYYNNVLHAPKGGINLLESNWPLTWLDLVSPAIPELIEIGDFTTLQFHHTHQLCLVHMYSDVTSYGPFFYGSQAYIKKGRTPIQVFPVLNAYTPILLLFAHAYYAFCLQIAISTECGHQGVRIHVHLNRNVYYAWENNKRIGVRIQDSIYLNRCTPFLNVSLWVSHCTCFSLRSTWTRMEIKL